MIEVGARDARTRFAALLDRAARGEEVSITRRGRPVARIVPADPPAPARTDDTLGELRALRAGQRLDGIDWKALRDEGRP